MKTKNLFAPSLLLLAAIFTGCNKDETQGDRLPEGKYPLTLIAGVDGQTTTRATTDNTWTDGDEVAIIIDDAATAQKYIADASGTLTTANPYYWQNTTEIKKISAWYPYSETKPTTFAVWADQSGDGYQSSDMLWSKAEIGYNTSEIKFKHLPVKVIVNLKSGNGVLSSDVENATVTIVNQHLISKEIATDWTVTKHTTTGVSDINSKIASVTADYHKTVQALVVPQLISTAGKFIKVSVAGIDYYYTTTLDLKAGMQYTYNIIVSKNELIVEVVDATVWTGSAKDVNSKISAPNLAPNDLKIGDFYYSDDKYSDGGYREYTDGTKTILPIMPVLTGESGPRTVIGIVFKVGLDITDTYQYKLKDGVTDKTMVNGYVLALSDANGGNKCKWGPGGDNVKIDNPDMDRNKLSGFHGYKNTNAIKTFARTTGRDLSGFAAVNTAINYGIVAPENSSGWFLPSAGQCLYWLNNKDVLLSSVRRAIGNNSYGWNQHYWSSSEDTDTKAYYLHMFENESSMGTPNIYSGEKNAYGYDFHVRSILVF